MSKLCLDAIFYVKSSSFPDFLFIYLVYSYYLFIYYYFYFIIIIIIGGGGEVVILSH